MFNTMDIILKNLNPDFEKEYYDHMIKELWSTDEFSALTQRLSPRYYKEIVDENFDLEQLSNNKRKQALTAMQLNNKLLLDIRNEKIENVHYIEKETLVSAWKCIKWLAENQIPIKKMFFKALPLSLMELYLEFQPMNAALRNKNIFSRDFHEAYYLKNAKKLIKINCNPMTLTEIYNHPYMKNNIQRQIRKLKGNYKKSTIIKSWLPKLFPKRKKGCPKKLK
jgi:hypothetical protein